jgi:type II secretory pathway pseudopilin PulG
MRSSNVIQSSRRDREGFSLVELMIVAGTLIIVFTLAFVALQSAVASEAVAKAKQEALSEARDVMSALVAELQLARKNLPSEDPRIQVVTEKGASPPGPVPVSLSFGSKTELHFRVPLDGTGKNDSAPIRYRYINEDRNQNHILDEDEDGVVFDDILTRRLVRVGEASPGVGPVVERIIGGANDLSDVRFDLNPAGNVLTITITSTKGVSGTRTIDRDADEVRQRTISATLTGRVYLGN